MNIKPILAITFLILIVNTTFAMEDDPFTIRAKDSVGLEDFKSYILNEQGELNLKIKGFSAKPEGTTYKIIIGGDVEKVEAPNIAPEIEEMHMAAIRSIKRTSDSTIEVIVGGISKARYQYFALSPKSNILSDGEKKQISDALQDMSEEDFFSYCFKVHLTVTGKPKSCVMISVELQFTTI